MIKHTENHRGCIACYWEGLEERDNLTQLALDAKQEWKEAADKVIQYYIRRNKPFTSEDITDQIGLPAGSTKMNKNNAVGAIILKYSKSRRIYQCGTRPARNKSSHGHELKVWRSGYQPPDQPERERLF